MRELVEHLQDAIEALKREIVRNPKSDEYRKRTLHHRQTNLGAGGGKSIALTIKGSNAIALPTHGSGRFESRATVYDPKQPFRGNAKLGDSTGRGPRVKATPERIVAPSCV